MSNVEKSAEYLLEHWGRWVVLGSGVFLLRIARKHHPRPDDHGR